MRVMVLTEYGDVCHLCGEHGSTSLDHVTPRSCGGDDSLDNLRPAHVTCNSKRGAMPLTEWFARHPLTIITTKPSRDW